MPLEEMLPALFLCFKVFGGAGIGGAGACICVGDPTGRVWYRNDDWRELVNGCGVCASGVGACTVIGEEVGARMTGDINGNVLLLSRSGIAIGVNIGLVGFAEGGAEALGA